MKFLSTIVVAALIATGALTIGYVNEGQAQDAAATVKERSALMKGMGGAAGRINKADDAKATVDDAKLIQANLQKLGGLFPAGSMTPDSRAKAEIWSMSDDFKAKLSAAQMHAASAVASSEKGDLDGTKGHVKNVVAACNVCHDVYRGPAKQ
jgi:cytochrome c556